MTVTPTSIGQNRVLALQYGPLAALLPRAFTTRFVGDSSKRDLNGRPSDLVCTDYRGLVCWNGARRSAVTVCTDPAHQQQLVECRPHIRPIDFCIVCRPLWKFAVL